MMEVQTVQAVTRDDWKNKKYKENQTEKNGP